MFSMAHDFHSSDNKNKEVQSLSSMKHGTDLQQEWGEKTEGTGMAIETH